MKSLKKEVRSGVRSGVGAGSGSISQRYGSAPKSHRSPALILKHDVQVSGYGENGTGDANDVWRVEIDGGKEGDIVKTVLSR